MGSSVIKSILVLTSSRADFGIYVPLLKKLKDDTYFELRILAFGTHLSKFHGYTITDIYDSGFDVDFKINSLVIGDKPVDIASSFALTLQKFADFWNNQIDNFDWVIVLGDRFEMAAAVLAGIPYGIKFAHLYGGEITLGATDNIYRNAITLASKLHFVSLAEFKTRVDHIMDSTCYQCHVIGSLSLDNLKDIKLLSADVFKKRWNIDLNKDFILITVHPETVAVDKNKEYAECLFDALKKIGMQKQLVVTMPNADVSGIIYREAFNDLKLILKDNLFLIENFGTQSYFTCMKNAGLLIGNTSSGITEAASFNKYVINLGDRQKGRPIGNNVISIDFDANLIIELESKYFGKFYEGCNIYHKDSAAEKIVNVLKQV